MQYVSTTEGQQIAINGYAAWEQDGTTVAALLVGEAAVVWLTGSDGYHGMTYTVELAAVDLDVAWTFVDTTITRVDTDEWGYEGPEIVLSWVMADGTTLFQEIYGSCGCCGENTCTVFWW